MIIGGCPYDDCNAPLLIPIAEVTPRLERHECEDCGRVIWTYHSRWEPWSMTEAEFLAEYIVDEETRTIERRGEAASDNCDL